MPILGAPSLMVSTTSNRNKPFVPSDFSGLKIWLEADSLVLNDGDPVVTWSDQSGNGFNATQATGSLQPLFKTNIVNGLPVVRFDGTDDFLSFLVAGSLDIYKNAVSGTMFAVASDTNISGGDTTHTVIVFSGGGAVVIRASITSKITSSTFTSRARRLDADTTVSSTALFSSGFHVLTADNNWTANINQIYVDGVSAASVGYSSGGGNTENTSSTTATLSSATTRFFGDIAAILVYQPGLSPASRQVV